MNRKALIVISALTAFIIAAGGALGVVLVGGQPTVWQVLAAVLLGLGVAAKDTRSLLKLPPVTNGTGNTDHFPKPKNQTMKNKIINLLAAVCLVAGFTTQAQDNAELKSALVSLIQQADESRSVTLAVYPSYAPDIVIDGKPDNFGFGIAALAPASLISDSTIAKYAFGGVRLDYLGSQAYASTVAVGFKFDLQIKGHTLTWLAHSGVNIPFSGFGKKNGELGAIVGSGFYTRLFTFAESGSLGIQLSAEKWTQFPGPVFHGGPVLNWRF